MVAIALILLFVACVGGYITKYLILPPDPEVQDPRLERKQEAEPPTDITPYIVWAVLIIVALSAFASLFD